MSKKYGLGKGLKALIPDSALELSEKDENGVNYIDIDFIQANRDQPRKTFDKDKIVQLSQSIKEHGIIQPLILNKLGDNMYNIVAGERRWRAAKLIGVKKIPAIIMNLSDGEVLEISLIENIQRQDLNPIEEALAYRKLINDFNLTQEELSAKIGKSRTSISNCMRLLNLDSRVQKYIMDGVITEGHGRALLGVENGELQHKLSLDIINRNLTVRDVEKIIRNLHSDKKDKVKVIKEENIYYLDIKERLENLLGTKVLLMNKKNKGKIEIEYYSQEDLQRILDILKI
ncbi:ParB/RepB/Spo0J family partition protein [Clostridium luticellarii]|uniref:Putative chromosome-partitioning protein ParB n=1 Tax=Clostridium luticellarii TaxID=1691940 RepID=A0A2T0B7D2_9CLOT|nr:ParB/RepB/Spo0J family partition protein [Clostridium luticellarii]MCI1945856.1 ParB/RepB/Spo0J family partition protein [Clostridium luticellarii]MCI1969188.1 ParB/RepB/Spo0J family partition protein [Clostridium luticellarii]MCI1996168.1 ParB/RepB/Spo0J family partition protein [Clostridium luticellarii]MCI2040499.1 ParB/RepB/Spo0J family partition protein [Clostridium luticellarii]PRR79723.1 putative chromosome-partitioning protein ParB [Clostridium luticellarii]